MRNLKLIGLFLLVGICSSYGTDDDNYGQLLNGIYTESAPNPGTPQLNFVDNNTLILKARNSADKEFIYEINGDTIKFIPRDLNQTWDLEFHLINKSKFEINNISTSASRRMPIHCDL